MSDIPKHSSQNSSGTAQYMITFEGSVGHLRIISCLSRKIEFISISNFDSVLNQFSIKFSLTGQTKVTSYLIKEEQPSLP